MKGYQDEGGIINVWKERRGKKFKTGMRLKKVLADLRKFSGLLECFVFLPSV